MSGHNILVLTHPPYDGGVPAKAKILCEHLASLGHRVSVAWYATFAHQGNLNVPAWKLPVARPGIMTIPAFGDFVGYAVGCRLPELEAPYYRLTSRWRDLIDRHDRHIAVGGPPMVANILVQAGIPHFLWCASDVMADRQDRQRQMPWPRKAVDALVTRPWLRTQQNDILRTSPLILGVSDYTLDQLRNAGASPQRLKRLPIPVNPEIFRPGTNPPSGDVVGLAARFEDPRKNLPLLLKAFALLRRQRPGAVLRLAGCTPSAATQSLVSQVGLDGAVEFVGALPSEVLPSFYGSLGVFALPSWQEGLCLAALEAMACGVPVVSTSCGGPTDFVRDDINGYLVKNWQPESMAQALDRALTHRSRLSTAARHVAVTEFSPAAFAHGVAEAWRHVWGQNP